MLVHEILPFSPLHSGWVIVKLIATAQFISLIIVDCEIDSHSLSSVIINV